MTLPLNSRLSALYDTNGTQKDFSFGFRVFFDPDNGGYGLEVRRQTADGYEVIPKSDYLVLPVEDNSAGVVRFGVAPSAGQQIYIAGKTPTIQQLVLTNFGRYSAESIETQFDFITAIIQEWLSALDEETRQRIAADEILTQYVVQRIDAFVQEVNQNFDDKSQEIDDYIATIMPSLTQTLREEIEAFAVSGMQDAIDQTLAESKAEIDDAVARANAAALAAAITGKVYDTPEAGVNPVTGVANGAYFNVRSTDDESYIDEYQNVGGSAVATGKSYPSYQVVAALGTKVAKIYHIETHSISDVQDLNEPTGTKLTLHAGRRSGEFTIRDSAEQITLDKTRTDAPLFTLEQAADLDVFNAVFIKTKNGVAVRDISYSVKAGWFGVAYDWEHETQTGTDDTEKLRAAMYFAAAWKLPLSTDSGAIRTTSQLLSQKDGYWKALTWESNNTEVIADHAGNGMRCYGGVYKFTQRGNLAFSKSNAFKTTGGNSFPDLTSLSTYSASKNYGVVFDGNQHDVENITAFGFNAGVIFYIGEFNMNYSKHNVRVTGNDLGALVFGPFDDASVIETEITAFENFQEGVYVKPGVNFRQWTGRIRAENNLKDRITNPAIAGRYAVYIGHHIACDLWFYVEQYEYLTPGTFELYVSDTGSSTIFSARKNTDYIRGNNTAQSGNTFYQHFYVGNPATRQATPLRLQGFGVRFNDPNDFVEMPIVADDVKYGSVRGQAGRIGIHSQNSTQSITLSDNNVRLGKSFNGIFTDEVALSSASPTFSQLIKTLYLSNEASIGTLTVIGSSNDPTYGYIPYILKVDFYINGGVVTLNNASRMYFNNSEGQSSANIRQDGSNVYLDLAYNPAWHGSNYYFKYKLELISAIR